MNVYTAVIQKKDDWWVGCLKEMPNVLSQGETRDELLENLESALHDVLEANQEEAMSGFDGASEEVRISPQPAASKPQGELA